MTEPDVALTDYGVTLECALLTGLLFLGVATRGALRRSFAIFFAASGMAALAGGTVHGFFPSEDSIVGAALWRIALLGLGLTALAAWSIGARLMFTERTARVIEAIAGAELFAYTVVVLAVDQRFWIAIANYAPAAVFLGVSFLVAYRRTPAPPTLAGLIGLVLTIVAAIVQRRHIALDATYLNHNALYHLIQMVAFALIFLTSRHFIAAPAAADAAGDAAATEAAGR
jgi:xanthosine utilization system XapX-like protein